jgi:AbrB family looped-hinge helix DNA binding protein
MNIEVITVSSKVQVAIPKAIREEIQLKESDKLAVYVSDGIIVMQKVRAPDVESFEAAFSHSSFS